MNMKCQLFGKMPVALGTAPTLVLLISVTPAVWAPTRISPEMTERIFERLFQTAGPPSAGRKGLGLGLFNCRELVTPQGGQIWAKSALGQGIVFS
jgi:signal transduction histidine kinase